MDNIFATHLVQEKGLVVEMGKKFMVDSSEQTQSRLWWRSAPVEWAGAAAGSPKRSMVPPARPCMSALPVVNRGWHRQRHWQLFMNLDASCLTWESALPLSKRAFSDRLLIACPMSAQGLMLACPSADRVSGTRSENLSQCLLLTWGQALRVC